MNLREGWNFHNDIAINLERIARNTFNPGKAYGSDDTIYCADAIETNTFAEVMIILLRKKYGYKENTNIDNFSAKLQKVWAVSGIVIEPEVAESLFTEFKILFEK